MYIIHTYIHIYYRLEGELFHAELQPKESRVKNTDRITKRLRSLDVEVATLPDTRIQVIRMNIWTRKGKIKVAV